MEWGLAAVGIALLLLLPVLTYRHTLLRLWREPVLKWPVLIIESDDWGPGPPQHASALEEISTCLEQYRDALGNPAVMTLGVVLSLPDVKAIVTNGASRYQSTYLDDENFAQILQAIKAGSDKGVFATQLHGDAHCWPSTLLSAIQTGALEGGLDSEELFDTETLAPHFQSRWVNASTLPSRPLPVAAISAAVEYEVKVYFRIFGTPPRVVVPPTFVWDRHVELAWAKNGIDCVVTPGTRLEWWDEQGRPKGRGEVLFNGETGTDGCLYLVRDKYFEPKLGHTDEQILSAMEEKTARGRPCLVETHRFNFTEAVRESSLKELGRALKTITSRYKTIRFISTEALAREYRQGGEYVEYRILPRLLAWSERVRGELGFWRLARLTGLAWILILVREAIRKVSSTS